MGVVTFSFWIHQKTRKNSSRMLLALRTCFSHQMSAPVGAGFSSKHVSAELLATRCHKQRWQARAESRGEQGPTGRGARALYMGTPWTDWLTEGQTRLKTLPPATSLVNGKMWRQSPHYIPQLGKKHTKRCIRYLFKIVFFTDLHSNL